MNILYLLFSFTTGGTERLITDICNQMIKQNHNVHLFIVNDLYSQNMLQAVNPAVKIHLYGRPVGGKKLKTILDITKYIRNNRIQVVHCNSFDAPELLLLQPIAFPKVKILHTIHDVGQYKKLGKLKIALRNLICDRFVAISQCVKDDIIQYGANAGKVHVVYNAIDLTRFQPASRSHNPNDNFRIGSVARIMPEKKGQDVLLEAIGLIHKKYPKIQCVFAGEPDTAHQEAFCQLKETARALDIADQVSFLGNVDDVPGLLATLDVFVLPSRYEGFGISLVEAMAMGIPCIASCLDGPAEVLQNGKYGLLFPVGNAQELALKLEQLIEDYATYKTSATETIQYVKTQYNIVNMCAQLEALMN